MGCGASSEAPVRPANTSKKARYAVGVDWAALPGELIIAIFQYLTPDELRAAACVCQVFNIHTYDISLRKRFGLSNDRVNDSVLQRAASRHVDYTSLDLSGCKNVTDAGLLRLLPACPQLEEIILNTLPGVTGDSFLALARYCPGLRSAALAVTGFNETATDATLVALARGCPKLTTLNVSGWTIRDEGLQQVAASCPNLESITFSGVHATTTDASLRALATNCPRLSSITIVAGAQITSGGIEALFESCHALTRLVLRHCRVETFSAGRKMPSLLTLHMDRVRISDTALARILERAPSLEALHVRYASQLGSGWVGTLRECRRMTHVDCTGSAITDAGVESLLKAVPLCRLHRVNLTHTGITDAGVRRLLEAGSDVAVIDVADCPKVTSSVIIDFYTARHQMRAPSTNGSFSLNSSMSVSRKTSADNSTFR